MSTTTHTQAQQPRTTNRRQLGRVKCASMSCQFGPVSDLSKSGLRVLTKRPMVLPEGAATHLRLTCAGQTMVVAARPTYSRPRADGLCDTGFMLIGLSEEGSRALIALARTAAMADERVTRVF